MPIDTETPRSPGWWLEKLQNKLAAKRIGEPLPFGRSSAGTPITLGLGQPQAWSSRSVSEATWAFRPGIDLLDDYLRGDPPLPSVSVGWKQAVRPFIRMSRLNASELVIASALDRMIPLGWATAVENDRDGDQIADRIAKVNDFESTYPETLEHMLCMAEGYMAVGKHPRRAEPLITPQDPRGCVLAEDSATGDPLASLIVRADEWTGDVLAHVHLYAEAGPAGNETVVFRRKGMVGDWAVDEGLSGPTPGFEVVRFRNKAGVGDFERHLDLLDRVNDQIFRRVIIAIYQAFRQRGAKGLPRHTEDGKEIDYQGVFMADPGAFWDIPEGVEMWESGVVDLAGIRSAVKDDMIAVAAVTGTSLHYITPDAAAGSAEGASTMRERMIYRVEDRRRRANGATAKVMAAAFRLMGEDQRADALSIRTLWQPAERWSINERAQAAAQAKAAGMPFDWIATEIWSVPPAELDRLTQMRGSDLLFTDAAQPQAPSQAAPAAQRVPAQAQPVQQPQTAA